ncbi:MAG: SDR family NAD(P)-dependent oxidoreductase [Alphaproteobacteria bacterium]|nr:SDR family NAD(P)-dependent oxidoreductase [Alphaproteobacteria bacterium]
MTFSGKHIWLIGASEGIGEALAAKLALAGAHVCLSARQADKLEALKGSLQGTNHLTAALDVTSMDSLKAAWEKIHQNWPRVDTVIYNAGTYVPMDATQFDLAKVERTVDVNFLGAHRMLSLVLPYFIQQQKGHIALVASVAGYRGLPAAMGYGASKAALIHLAENLKADLKDMVKVQVINPGFVATRLTAKNNFHMPMMITAQKAADYIFAGLQSSRFEIHFPPAFSLLLKALARLPYGVYFWLLKHMKF